MFFAGKGVLRGLEHRLHESVYYMAERCYLMEVVFFRFFCDGAVRG